MTNAPITPDNLVPAALAHAERRGFAAGWRPGLDPVAWQERGRAILRELALPDLPEPPVTAELLTREDRGDHWCAHLRLDFGTGFAAEALLLMPVGQGPFPAVLALHDHGSEFSIGKEKCIPPPGSANGVAEHWWARFFGGQPIGPALVRRGFAVLSVDALGWGARRGNGYDAQQALAANLLQIGLSPAGLMAWEDTRAAVFLADHPAVDATRIAAVGFSMGGFRAWQLAALEPRIAATVAVGWMASLPGLLVPGNNQTRGQSAYWMIHPLLSRHLDLPDIASLAAPKPFWAEVGLADPLFPAPAVDAAFARLAEVWRAFGACGQLALHRPEAGHSFLPTRQVAVFDWLAHHLR